MTFQKTYFFTHNTVGCTGCTHELFTYRCRLDIRKFRYTFSDRVDDRWNYLSDFCVNSSTNGFKEICFSRTETGNYKLCMSVKIVGLVALYGVNLCLLVPSPSVSSMLVAVGKESSYGTPTRSMSSL